MRKSYFAMLAIAAGVALTAFASAPANALPVAKTIGTTKSDIVQARHGGGHGGIGLRHGGMRHGGLGIRHGGIRHGGIHHGGFGFRHVYRPRLYVAPVYGYRSYDSGCYWLKRKALNTGSRYWWRRYNACRWG